MNWGKIFYKKFSIILFLILSIFLSGVILCKHTELKDEKKDRGKVAVNYEDLRAQREFLGHLDRMDRLYRRPANSPGIMSAYSSSPEDSLQYGSDMTGQEFSKTDMVVQSMCFNEMQFVVVSKSIGNSVALAVEQVRNTEDKPMLCSDNY